MFEQARGIVAHGLLGADKEVLNRWCTDTDEECSGIGGYECSSGLRGKKDERQVTLWLDPLIRFCYSGQEGNEGC